MKRKKEMAALALFPTPEQDAWLRETAEVFHYKYSKVRSIIEQAGLNQYERGNLMSWWVRERLEPKTKHAVDIGVLCAAHLPLKENEFYLNDIKLRRTKTENKIFMPLHWKSTNIKCLGRSGWSEIISKKCWAAHIWFDKLSSLWRATVFCAAPSIEEPVWSGRVLGVDLGIKRLAVLSDGTFLKYGWLRHKNERDRQLIAKLQQHGTRSALRRAKWLWRKIRHRNQTAAHQLVAEVMRHTEPGDAVAIEDLGQLNERIQQYTGAQNRRLAGSFPYGLIRCYLKLACEKSGRKLVVVNPADTSRMCSKCGQVDRRSRKSQAHFVCTSCGYQVDADLNAARNIAARAGSVLANGGAEGCLTSLSACRAQS